MTFGSFDCEPRRRLLCSELPPRSIAGKRPMEPRARSFVRRQFRTLPGLRLFFMKRDTQNVSKIIIFGTTRVSPYIHIPEIQCSITVHTAGLGQPRRRGGIRSYKKGTLKNEPWRLRDERPTKDQCSIPSFLLCPPPTSAKANATRKERRKKTLVNTPSYN